MLVNVWLNVNQAFLNLSAMFCKTVFLPEKRTLCLMYIFKEYHNNQYFNAKKTIH